MLVPSVVKGQSWPQAASVDPMVSWIRITEGNWTFAPAGEGEQVKGFLAWMDPNLAVTGNVTVLWFQREVGDHWTMWGWQNATKGEAAAWVGRHLETAPQFVADPELGTLAFDFEALQIPPQDPLEMSLGLFIGDPAAEFVEHSLHPTQAMDMLCANGWAVAPTLSALVVNSSLPCSEQGYSGVEAMLNGFTTTVEETFFGASTVSTSCQWPCSGCTRVYGAWTPGTGPWTLMGRRQTAPGTDTCYWSRPGTRTWTEMGKTWFLCRTCSGTGTDSGPETTTTTVLRSDPCVPPP